MRLIDITKAISNDKSLVLFNTFALASGSTTDTLNTKLKLIRKQYYSKISRLISAGLVTRKKNNIFSLLLLK